MLSPRFLKTELALVLKFIRRVRGKTSKIPRRKLLILAVLIVANISLLFYLVFRRSTAQDVTSPQDLKEIPTIDVVDDTGTRISLSSLIGKVVIVQFINPDVSSQVDSVSKMLTKFGAEVSFVLIARDSHELRERVQPLSGNVLIIQQDYAELKRIFNVPECCERRFIFDTKGKLGYHDYYYEADLTARLNVLVQKPLPPLSSALLESLGSLPKGTFTTFVQRTRDAKSGKAAVAIFTSVCTSCQSGELVRILNLYAKKRPDVSFLALLPKDYTGTDIENFRSNLGVQFSVEKVDEALSKEFGKLVSTYGQNRLNGVVLLINRGSLAVIENPDEVNLKLSQL